MKVSNLWYPFLADIQLSQGLKDMKRMGYLYHKSPDNPDNANPR